MQLFDNDYNTLPTSLTTTHPSTDHPPPHHKKQWLKANSKNPKRQPQKRKQFPNPLPKTLPPPKKTNIFYFSLSQQPQPQTTRRPHHQTQQEFFSAQNCTIQEKAFVGHDGVDGEEFGESSGAFGVVEGWEEGEEAGVGEEGFGGGGGEGEEGGEGEVMKSG